MHYLNIYVLIISWQEWKATSFTFPFNCQTRKKTARLENTFRPFSNRNLLWELAFCLELQRSNFMGSCTECTLKGQNTQIYFVFKHPKTLSHTKGLTLQQHVLKVVQKHTQKCIKCHIIKASKSSGCQQQGRNETTQPVLEFCEQFV